MMYKNKTSWVDQRILSVAQPWIRPIVRGKASVTVEFRPNLAISVVDGLVRAERFSFENFKEGLPLQESAELYQERTGKYPARILADKIYRNRENPLFCKEDPTERAGSGTAAKG